MPDYNITPKQFDAYEKVRSSGVTNMLDLNAVVSAMKATGADITRDEVKQIHKNYEELKAT